MKDLEHCTCILAESKNLKLYELSYLLGKATAVDIAQRLAEEEGIHVSTTIVKIHLDRHIPLSVQEEVVDYLPSIASTCAIMLTKVKGRAMTYLDNTNLDDKEVKLLSVLVSEVGKYLDKYGQITGEADSIHTANIKIAPSHFEQAAMDVLPEYPDVWVAIKNRMAELEIIF